jgi:hypothetical protein
MMLSKPKRLKTLFRRFGVLFCGEEKKAAGIILDTYPGSTYPKP